MSELSLDECEKIFAKAESTRSQNDFREEIEPLLNFYEVLSFEFNRGSQYYRARSFHKNHYTNSAELGYPPKELSKTGRLNDPGAPWMYLAARKETAIAEIDATKDQRVQIAGFRIKPHESLRLSIVGELSYVQKTGRFFSIGVDPDGVINSHLNSMPYRTAQALIYIDRFFANTLSNPLACENDYIHSRALAKSLLEQNKSDGFLFPSVKDKNGLNIAILPSAADKSLHNTSCVLTTTKERKYGLIDYDIYHDCVGLTPQDEFIWSRDPQPGKLSIYNLTKDEYISSVASGTDPATEDGHRYQAHV